MKLDNTEIEKRIIVKLDKSIKSDNTSGIMTFGESNDYPQIIEKLIFGSQSAKACAKIYAKFIGGNGFSNPNIGSIVVGRDSKGKPITLDKIRREVSQSLAFFNGVYIHANFNAGKEVVDTRLLPFKTCRFSRIDDKGYCSLIGYHPNWSKDIEGKKFEKKDITWLNTFNLTDNVFQANVENAGSFDKFKGQVYFYHVDDNYLYPLSPFDSVYLDMDTEYQIQLFKNREIRNGFTDKIVIRRSKCIDEDDERETVNGIKDWSGPDGCKTLLLQDEFDENGQLVNNGAFKLETVATNMNDKLFENWEKSLANSIRKAAKGMPAVLIDFEQGGLSTGSGEMIKQATTYYNSLTQDDRTIVSEIIKEVYQHFNNDILKNNTDWSLKPITILEDVNTNIV